MAEFFKNRPPGPEKVIDISIIVPVFNEAAALIECGDHGIVKPCGSEASNADGGERECVRSESGAGGDTECNGGCCGCRNSCDADGNSDIPGQWRAAWRCSQRSQRNSTIGGVESASRSDSSDHGDVSGR